MEDTRREILEMLCERSCCTDRHNLIGIQYHFEGYRDRIRYGATEDDCPYKYDPSSQRNSPIASAAAMWKSGVLRAVEDESFRG